MTNSDKTIVPPLKIQGIKTKLLDFIEETTKFADPNGECVRFVEPFLGSGVVSFNMAHRGLYERFLCADINEHVIGFYKGLRDGKFDIKDVLEHLENNGKILSGDPDYYYEVRNRFNMTGDSLDFLFINRACFNGVMRFNSRGEFNTPFCKKPDRFSKAYVTKIVNQVQAILDILNRCDFEFMVSDFSDTIARSETGDLVYCDPPYVGLDTGYRAKYDHVMDRKLRNCLDATPAKCMVSTWKRKGGVDNEWLDVLWKGYEIRTFGHFYHVSGKIDGRRTVSEAILIRSVQNG